MYTKYWRLNSCPFLERTDPSRFYPVGAHQEAAVRLREAVSCGVPIATVVGCVGVGKSMVAAVAARKAAADGCVVAALEPLCGPEAKPVEVAWGPVPSGYLDSEADLPATLGELTRRLDQPAMLVLDKADAVPDDLLCGLVEFVRAWHERLGPPITLVLLGTPELSVRAERIGLQLDQGKESSTVYLWLRRLEADQTSGYLRHQLRLSGGSLGIFAPAAIEVLHELSGGVPRRINRLADMCMLIAFARGRGSIDKQTVIEAQRELSGLAESRTPRAQRYRGWSLPSRRKAQLQRAAR